MDSISRSFGIEGASGRRLARSRSLILASELENSEILVGYERLSKSMRFTENSGERHKHRGWRFIVKAFGFKRKRGKAVAGGNGAEAGKTLPEPEVVVAPKVKNKKKSSWLPDRDRRWPIQGW